MPPATLMANVAFKSPSLKAISKFRSSEHELPVLLARQLQYKNLYLALPQPDISKLALLHTVKWTQVWFSNRSPPGRVEGEHQSLHKPVLEGWASWPILRAESWTCRPKRLSDQSESGFSALRWNVHDVSDVTSLGCSLPLCHTCGKGMWPAIPVDSKCCPTIKPSATAATLPLEYSMKGIQDGEKQEIFCALDTGPR